MQFSERREGKRCLTLIQKQFGKNLNSPLAKIFNTNTLKLSYSCVYNVADIIRSHKRKISEVSNSEKYRPQLHLHEQNELSSAGKLRSRVCCVQAWPVHNTLGSANCVCAELKMQRQRPPSSPRPCRYRSTSPRDIPEARCPWSRFRKSWKSLRAAPSR